MSGRGCQEACVCIALRTGPLTWDDIGVALIGPAMALVFGLWVYSLAVGLGRRA